MVRGDASASDFQASTFQRQCSTFNVQHTPISQFPSSDFRGDIPLVTSNVHHCPNEKSPSRCCRVESAKVQTPAPLPGCFNLHDISTQPSLILCAKGLRDPNGFVDILLVAYRRVRGARRNIFDLGEPSPSRYGSCELIPLSGDGRHSSHADAPEAVGRSSLIR